MPSLPAARISHFTARRLRIKVPEKRRDRAFFDTVAERLATWDSVEGVETNPLTASVLIHFSDPEGLFLVCVPAARTLSAVWNDRTAAWVTAGSMNPRTRPRNRCRTDRFWRPPIDMRGVLFVLLLAGGVFQLLRRRLDAPAPTLLWYAGDLIGLWHDRGPDPAIATPSGPVSGQTG